MFRKVDVSHGKMTAPARPFPHEKHSQGPRSAPWLPCPSGGLSEGSTEGLLRGERRKETQNMAHNDNRTHNVSISLSDEEFERLSTAVKESGMVKAKYCRAMLLSESHPHGMPEKRMLMSEYNRVLMPIGRTLNNAYMAMRQNGVNEKTVAKLELALEKFGKLADEVLKGR